MWFLSRKFLGQNSSSSGGKKIKKLKGHTRIECASGARMRFRCMIHVIWRTWLEHFVRLTQCLGDFGICRRIDPIGHIPHMPACKRTIWETCVLRSFWFMLELCICPLLVRLSHKARADRCVQQKKLSGKFDSNRVFTIRGSISYLSHDRQWKEVLHIACLRALQLHGVSHIFCPLLLLIHGCRSVLNPLWPFCIGFPARITPRDAASLCFPMFCLDALESESNFLTSLSGKKSRLDEPGSILILDSYKVPCGDGCLEFAPPFAKAYGKAAWRN